MITVVIADAHTTIHAFWARAAPPAAATADS